MTTGRKYYAVEQDERQNNSEEGGCEEGHDGKGQGAVWAAPLLFEYHLWREWPLDQSSVFHSGGHWRQTSLALVSDPGSP
eukprot:4887512-Pyramimonas_sp.AAC.1